MRGAGPGLREVVLAPLIVVGVAAIVVTAAALGGAFVGQLSSPPQLSVDDEDLDGPPREYAPENVALDPIPAEGTVELDRSLRADGEDDAKTVLIESSGRVRQEDLRQFVRALVLAGHDVRFREDTEGLVALHEDLEDADAYVRVDTSFPLSDEELGTVRNFTDQGGNLVLLAEPNRRRVSAGAFGATLDTVRTDTIPLAAEYGIVFGNRYLYDTQNNDGNFKDILVEPTDASGSPDLDRATLYTATHVSARSDDATVVARTIPSTRLSRNGDARGYPIAVRTSGVLAVGDTTFMSEGRHNVADNERLIEYVAAFAVRGDRPESATLDPEEDENGSDSGF